MPERYLTLISKRAAADLEGIHAYVEHDSDQNAAHLIGTLFMAMETLGELPHRYPVHSGVRQPGRVVRRMPVGNYLVYYRIDEPTKAVQILHVRHAARRQPSRFD